MKPFFFLALLFSSSLFAEECCPDRYFVRGELLLFKPTIEQSAFVIKSSDNLANFEDNLLPFGTRHNNDMPFRPGVRLEWVWGCHATPFDLDFRAAYFSEAHSTTVRGPILLDTLAFPGDSAQTPEDTSYNGQAKYRQDFRYFAIDGTINRMNWSGCSDNFFFLMGLHLGYLRFNENASSDGFRIDDDVRIGVANRFERESNFWGIGPQFGFDYRLLLPKCGCGVFTLDANARASILASRTNSLAKYTTPNTTPTRVDIRNQPLWRVTPCLDTRLGLVFECPIRCFDCTFEFGYEFLWYCNAVDTILGYEVAFPGDSIDVYSNLSLQGPYFALGCTF